MRFFAAIICLLLTPGVFAQEPSSHYVEKEEKQFSFFPGGKIEISAGAPGSLKIIGWDKGSIRVEAEKIVYYLSPDEAKDEIRKSPMRVKWNQTSAVIRTANAPSGNLEINLTVFVPRDKTDIRATINKGDFTAEGINGWVEASIATEGSLDAKSMSGYFSASTMRGDISADMTGKRWRGLEFAALTHNGSAGLLLPIDFSAALQLETRNGKISVDYPPQVVEGETLPPDIVINKTSQSLKASVGDGGAPIKIVTYSGDVALSKKEN